MAVYKITASRFNDILSRAQAELTRRNGYGDLSSYATIDYPVGTTVATGKQITIDGLNTLIEALGYINTEDLPSDVAFEDYINESDLLLLEGAMVAFEAQSRGATSGNDCASLCSGMCVSQCTTGCLSTCTATCADTCELSCTDGCIGTCEGTCEGTCTGTCEGTCTSCTGCSGTCTAVCNWSCTNTCYTGCYTACDGTCKNGCHAACYVSCDKGYGPS